MGRTLICGSEPRLTVWNVNARRLKADAAVGALLQPDNQPLVVGSDTGRSAVLTVEMRFRSGYFREWTADSIAQWILRSLFHKGKNR
jgi:hypothetical protein